MLQPPSKPFVVGLLTDLERQVETFSSELQRAEARAAAVEAELQATASRYLAARSATRRSAERARRAAAQIAESNGELASLRQKMTTLQRRSDELRQAVRQTTDPDQQNQLRQQRAPYLVALEDDEKAVKKLTESAERARVRLHKAQENGLVQADTERQSGLEVEGLRHQLPSPYLYLQSFTARAGRAHCLYFLDADRAAWKSDLFAAITQVHHLHAALRAGRYRLDQNSDVVGGRALGTVEALHGLAAMGNWDGARALFALACDESLFFHQIFHVFRAWCFGLYVNGRHQELAAMLELHRYAEGSEGAYAQCYLALLQRDVPSLHRALPRLVAADWQTMGRAPWAGLGVLNLGALTLCRLAVTAQLAVPPLGPQVPEALLAT